MSGTASLFCSKYISSLFAVWLTLVTQPTQRRCKTAFSRDCWMDITLAVWGTNARTQFQARVPSTTCAMVCSARVSKGLRVFHYSSSECRSLQVLTHFGATRKWGSERRKTGLCSNWEESSPKPVYMAGMGIRPSTVLWEQGRDAFFLHPQLWQLQVTPRERGPWHTLPWWQGGADTATGSQWLPGTEISHTSSAWWCSPSPLLTYLCCMGWREDKSYKLLVRTKYPLVSSLREIQLGLITGVLNSFCISDDKKVLVHGWM